MYEHGVIHIFQTAIFKGNMTINYEVDREDLRASLCSDKLKWLVVFEDQLDPYMMTRWGVNNPK